MLKSKIEELYEQLKRDGRLTVLSPAEVAAINSRIREAMEACRRELARKAAQSEDDLAKIILNA